MTNEKHDRDAIVDRMLAGAMARGSAEARGACLDADTLAAWADNALDAGELAAAETHAADCARCQAMLAAMVKAAPATLDAVASPWRIPSIRWLIPLTAAAAAVIVWILVPLPGDPLNVRQLSQNAESAPARAATPAASDAVELSSPNTATSRESRQQNTLGQDKDVVDPSRRSAEGAKTEADRKALASPDAPAAVDAPARADASLEKIQEATAPAAAPAPAAQARAAAARAFSASAPEIVVLSSNPAIRWQILPGGAVQRSADGGTTWQTQKTGVSETVSAGASPSPLVCWLVGPGGIVLLSTDGSSWKRVAFPEAVPLVAVRATDDQTASVTTADGREFVTTDGGRTWTKAR